MPALQRPICADKTVREYGHYFRQLAFLPGGHDCAGNINQLILKAESYLPALEKTQGIIAEFVNPKYKDDTRTAFKSSTRLECMMQDFPHGLPSDASVGFTVVNQVRLAHLLILRSQHKLGPAKIRHTSGLWHDVRASNHDTCMSGQPCHMRSKQVIGSLAMMRGALHTP